MFVTLQTWGQANGANRQIDGSIPHADGVSVDAIYLNANAANAAGTD
jgi:hypothetical protein